MSLSAAVQVGIEANKTNKIGLTTSLEKHPISFGVNVGDCETAWSDRRTFGVGGADDINFATYFQNTIKLLFVRNLSATSTMALSAAPSAGQFRLFLSDAVSWNFAPMINTGSLTLRGYPIMPGGVFMASFPNSAGLSISAGGSTLRVGGTYLQSYEIFAMGV